MPAVEVLRCEDPGEEAHDLLGAEDRIDRARDLPTAVAPVDRVVGEQCPQRRLEVGAVDGVDESLQGPRVRRRGDLAVEVEAAGGPGDQLPDSGRGLAEDAADLLGGHIEGPGEHEGRTRFGAELLGEVEHGEGEEFAVGHGLLGEGIGGDGLGQPRTRVVLLDAREMAGAVDGLPHAHRRQPCRPRPHLTGLAFGDDGSHAHLGDDVLGMADVAEHPVRDAEEAAPALLPGRGRRSPGLGGVHGHHSGPPRREIAVDRGISVDRRITGARGITGIRPVPAMGRRRSRRRERSRWRSRAGSTR